MAKRIAEKEVASVRLLELELSEDEITVLTSALTMLLSERDDGEIEVTSGATRNEVEAILQDLEAFLKQSSHNPLPADR